MGPVARRTAAVADDHLKRFQRLSEQYGMRLPSIAERLGQRFVRPLAIDRLCALVRPAIEELQGSRSRKSFKRLEQEVARFTEEPSGVGFDVPSWLEALEDEAARVPQQIDTDNEEHFRLFKAFFAGGEDQFHASMSEEQWRAMFGAQCAWDATMAHNSVKALERHRGESSILVVLVGSGHVAYGLGIQRQAAQWQQCLVE